jgi:hypothetical protein
MDPERFPIPSTTDLATDLMVWFIEESGQRVDMSGDEYAAIHELTFAEALKALEKRLPEEVVGPIGAVLRHMDPERFGTVPTDG